MNDDQFKQFSTLLQDTNSIIQDEGKRREVYYGFDGIFTYLNSKQWQEKNLVEAHQYSEDAVFQNIAEGYFRLGFLEKPFFHYSKLVYELWYRKTIEFQNRVNKRIHKGTQLHQIASIHEFFNENRKAWDYYLAGFIEDILEGRNYAEQQGYRSLRRFNLSTNNLDLIAEEVKKFKGSIRYDPLLLTEELRKKFIIPTYEENESIDYIKMSRTKALWSRLKKKRRKNG